MRPAGTGAKASTTSPTMTGWWPKSRTAWAQPPRWAVRKESRTDTRMEAGGVGPSTAPPGGLGAGRARHAHVVKALDAEVGNAFGGRDDLLSLLLTGRPLLGVPDLDAGQHAGDDHISLEGEAGELAEMDGHRHPALAVGGHLGGAGEERPRRLPLLGTPGRQLPHVVRHPLPLVGRIHAHATVETPGHVGPAFELAAELGRQDHPAL